MVTNNPKSIYKMKKEENPQMSVDIRYRQRATWKQQWVSISEVMGHNLHPEQHHASTVSDYTAVTLATILCADIKNY